MSHKKFQPPVRFNGEKLDPDESNRYENYYVIHPTTSTSWFGTAAANLSGSVSAFVITNQAADYPRNLYFSIKNGSGSLNAGSAYVVGKDQFGQAQTETLGYPLGTTVQGIHGTKIFSVVTAATCTFGTGQVQNGTPFLGVAFGTEAGSNVFQFGLPVRIGAATDVIALTYVKNFVATALNAGTPSALVSTALHSFTGTEALGTATTYMAKVLSTYNSEGVPNLA